MLEWYGEFFKTRMRSGDGRMRAARHSKHYNYDVAFGRARRDRLSPDLRIAHFEPLEEGRQQAAD